MSLSWTCQGYIIRLICPDENDPGKSIVLYAKDKQATLLSVNRSDAQFFSQKNEAQSTADLFEEEKEIGSAIDVIDEQRSQAWGPIKNY